MVQWRGNLNDSQLLPEEMFSSSFLEPESNGIAPNETHPAHPHFHCKNCDVLQCLQPGSLKVDVGDYQRSFAGEIRGVDVRVEGICSACLKKARALRSKTS
jgi:Fe2+ or Zn2+ uptake regulation protein